VCRLAGRAEVRDLQTAGSAFYYFIMPSFDI
jgi:hypothetical protein